jgi:hypothetical protein
MAHDKPVSEFARRFVGRKIEEFRARAAQGSGLYYELFAQNFTDSIDALAARTKRPDLRDHILAAAQETGNYFGEDAKRGRWLYDTEAGDICWQGEPLEWMKQASGRTPAAEKYASPSRCSGEAQLTHDRSSKRSL